MISVVIPAYNEEKRIGMCLDALAQQQTTKQFEVIVVDNASTDNTIAMAKTYEKKLSIRIYTEKDKGRGAARHTGFAKADGEIILSTDADTVVPQNWVEQLVTMLQKTDAVAVTGTCRITDCDKTTNAIMDILQPIAMHLYRLLFRHYWLSGFNFGIYKDAYKKSGGFERHLNALEDIDLSFKVAKIGRIQYVSSVPVIFSGRRFQKNLVGGLFSYVSTFTEYFFFKKKNVVLNDIR